MIQRMRNDWRSNYKLLRCQMHNILHSRAVYHPAARAIKTTVKRDKNLFEDFFACVSLPQMFLRFFTEMHAVEEC